ncbi:RHS repeat-associated core domain-containing protein [Pseudomonas putida]|jgi:RHS repeat-associated protein|uniref:RHS repeat-associated core domain-containing protein n=1 Tax=Pseudomonas putida TaxID=303 RepID=UPI00037B9B2A|nr:RHS repeat-associated core domain-containing protein [Pseudomonas putida]USX34496.1 RHS repeat-associated core domain-containing protein [Pseudomonas putida]SIR90202.1 RHS repeat-associated core domain-containing protein [Pseudomonas putida]HBK50892.1 RHS repeat-associated core domain-containing protein [Pseudomonas sp.]
MPEIPTSPQRASEALLSQGDGVSNIHVERGLRQREWSFGPYGQLPPQWAVGGLRFVGQWFDPVVQGYLLGNGHRLYSPAIMRFLSPDRLSPFGAGGINAYAYCSGDPVNFHDPSGQVVTKTGLTKQLNILKLSKAPLRDFLKPLALPENSKETRLVYKLKNHQFETYVFKQKSKSEIQGAKQKANRIIGERGENSSGVWEYARSETLYRHNDLFIPGRHIPKEAVEGLLAAGFETFKFTENSFVELMVPGGWQSGSPDGGNIYSADPTRAGPSIRSTQPR